ncbi:hypothetical protein GH714_039993 [Hevea brasiliensis]|uniref:Uncharacterized protein n=1 Tax=Hevea brasiliensis TaxID=3981 RepID=A0A6A6MG67_HEVBR|nr:hypothetical protein GH714_039993 [Hevea brasiliensis]
MFIPKAMAKELYFNHDGSATKKLRDGYGGRASRSNLSPKGRECSVGNRYGLQRLVNDGEMVLKQIELEDSLENVGVKLLRQDSAKTNDLAGDGSATSVVLAHGLITEGQEVEDDELADIAAVSAGNDYTVGNMISDALHEVERRGIVIIVKGKYIENNLQIVKEMQFDHGYLSLTSSLINAK